jgi:hypothetical protein
MREEKEVLGRFLYSVELWSESCREKGVRFIVSGSYNERELIRWNYMANTHFEDCSIWQRDKIPSSLFLNISLLVNVY